LVFGLNYFERDELLFARVSTLLCRVNFFRPKGHIFGCSLSYKAEIGFFSHGIPSDRRTQTGRFSTLGYAASYLFDSVSRSVVERKQH